MIRRLSLAASIAALLLVAPARAADNTVIVTPGTGVTMRSVDVGSGVQSMMHILGNASGTAIYGTAGTANASVLTVQGIASMTPLLATVAGGVASGATDSGNPIKVGGKYNSSGVTLTDGHRGDIQLSAAGYLLVQGVGIAQGAAAAGVTLSGVGCLNTTSITGGTTATFNAFNCTPAGALRSDLSTIAGTTIVNGGVAGSQSVGGTVATNVAITANPVNLGAQAVSSENAAITTARQAQLVSDIVGKLIVLPYSNPENFVSGAITSAMTGTTTTSLVAAPAGSLRNYITQITCSNAHATQGTDIIIQDGSGGTTFYLLPAAAVYGGAVIQFPTPLRQPTAATAMFVANVTTGASTKCAASGYKGL